MRTVAAPSAGNARRGTQSIERAVYLLRELAARSHVGWGLRDLAQHCRLDQGTVHRMLKCLVAEGLVQQRESDHRYFIGPLAFELGLSVPHRQALVGSMQVVLKRIARLLPKTNAVGFLRSGDDCVCVARADTSSWTRAENRTRVGQRMPLLVRAAGVAMVAALPLDEARAVCRRNRERLAHFGKAHLDALEALVATSRRQGYTLNDSLIWHGVISIAVVFGPPQQPLGALTVSGRNTDLAPDALRKLVPAVRRAGEELAAESMAMDDA